MNPIFIGYLNDLRIVLGAYLDKLKVKNPLVFTVVATALFGVNAAFMFDKVNISPEVDPYVMAFLGMLNTYLSPRTSKEKAEFNNTNDSNNIMQRTDDNIEPVLSSEPVCTTEPVQEL